MKIDDIFSPSHVAPSRDLHSHGVGRADEAGHAGRAAAKTDHATDSASLSALGVELSRAIHHDSPEQVAKIGRLQQAVSNGTYDVPSPKVSAKIVASALGSEL
jgi:anti-sigma28 factor (negative regulator of flagellin synthesis)